MNRMWLAAALALACAACANPEPPLAARGDGAIARGAAFAVRNCARCHAIQPGERLSPIAQATPFQAIAETPGLTRIALTAWLNTSHPTMPDLVVEPERIDDLWAYLQSLGDDG